VALLPPTGNNRLVNVLRANPRLLIALLKETMFRGCFHRDLTEIMLPDLGQDPRFREIFPALLQDPEGLVNDPARFATFLDEYERRMPPPSTLLCGWTADGTHENYGPGPRPDYWSFLADLAVWFSAAGTDESPHSAPSR